MVNYLLTIPTVEHLLANSDFSEIHTGGSCNVR